MLNQRPQLQPRRHSHPWYRNQSIDTRCIPQSAVCSFQRKKCTLGRLRCAIPHTGAFPCIDASFVTEKRTSQSTPREIAAVFPFVERQHTPRKNHFCRNHIPNSRILSSVFFYCATRGADRSHRECHSQTHSCHAPATLRRSVVRSDRIICVLNPGAERTPCCDYAPQKVLPY
jgi:hypothetical protein